MAGRRAVVLRGPRRAGGYAALRGCAGLVHAGAAGVHLPRVAFGIAVFKTARVRSRRVRREKLFRRRAGRSAGQAIRRQRQHADARPAALGVLRLPSAGGGAHLAPGRRT